MARCHNMGCGDADKDGVRDGEDFRRLALNKVADDSVQGGRCSFPGSPSDPPTDIDDKVLIDPRLLLIGSKIGEGAHGKVYQGKYGEQIVAVKVLKHGDTPEEKEKRKGRFIREVNMISKVNHENLVKFIGACKDPVMVIATELLPGMSLKKYLSNIRPKQLDLHTAVNFALDIARAMDCLHANGIIHRDLKPDNLLLTANQKNVKLADFGLAREETLTEMMTAETGTYRWMAPELYSTVTLRRGEKKHYTNKVDVYSFGIVMWELLTNRMPFEGMSNLQAAYAAAFKQVRPPLPEDAPPELVFIVQSCWVEDPNIRPNFSQIVRMLSAIMYTLPSPSLHSVAVPGEASNRDIDAGLAEMHGGNADACQDEVSSRGTSSSTLYAPRGRKQSFLRQLFTLKKAQNRKS